jgi:glycosyltransferase involved in cell wall biosynthesis
MPHILKMLTGTGYRVVFFPANGAAPEPYVTELQQEGVTVLADHQQQMTFLQDAGDVLEFAILSRPKVAWNLLEDVRSYAPNCHVVYDTVDLHYLRLRRHAEAAEKAGDPHEARRLTGLARTSRELELSLMRVTDATLTVSDVERRLLAEEVPGARVEVLSNVHMPSVQDNRPGSRHDAIFVGSFDHPPNVDAAKWLAAEIWPLVRRQLPTAVLNIVGSNPPVEVRDLSRDGVVVHGWVADLEGMYAAAKVTVAPLRFGAGVKGKVGESLAYGVPVVGTAFAFEGMNLVDGEDVVVGYSADTIASGVVSVLADDDQWSRLSANGAAAIDAQFGPHKAKDALLRILVVAHGGADDAS